MSLLRKATAASVGFARRYVENDLPAAVRFHILLNQSAEREAEPGFRIYLEDNDREYSCLTEEEVGGILFRDGRCPQWIDVSVQSHSTAETRVELLCCGRYIEDLHRTCYADRGMGPFGIKSPTLPPNYKEGIKFRLPIVPPCDPSHGDSAARSGMNQPG